jgi:aminoglycoside phosphotransferase (APT) family kinase protein
VIDREELRVFVEEVLGRSVEIGVRLPGHAGNSVHEARHRGGTSFVKVGSPEAMAVEVAVLELLARRDVAAPVVEARGALGGSAVVVLSAAEGEPVTDADVGLLGEELAKVHAVEVDGCGPLCVDGGQLRGASDWPPALEEATTFAQLADAGLVDEPTLSDAAAVASLLRRPDSPRLVHGDLHPRHVFTDGRRITAIIDWGDAMAGDPRYDRGRLFQVGLVETGLGRAYALAGLAEGAPEVAPLAAHGIAYILRAMTKGPLGPSPMVPWFEAQARALRTLCRLARPSRRPRP